MEKFVTTYELKKDKEVNERVIEGADTKSKMMERGIIVEITRQMRNLTNERVVTLDEVRLFGRKIEKLLKYYDEEVDTVKRHKAAVERLNDELAKREKEEADRQRVADLRAEADALEKRIEAKYEDETV